MKLSNLINPKFKSALVKLNEQPLPLKTAFKLKGIVISVEAELKKYEDVRQAAVAQYGKKNEDGSLATDEKGNASLEGDAAKAFVDQLNELLSLDVVLPTVTMSELGNIVMSSEELFFLDFISE
jgi:hypothetical protein